MVGLRTLDAIHLATAEVLHADRYGLESLVAERRPRRVV